MEMEKQCALRVCVLWLTHSPKQKINSVIT